MFKMKKIINKILIAILLFASVSSCEEVDNPIYDVFDGVTHGAVLRTLERVNSNFNLFDPNSEWRVVVEEQDELKGGLLSNVEVYVSFIDNKDDGIDNSKPETLIGTISSSEFTTSSNGLPTTNIGYTLAEATSVLGLSGGEYNGGDLFVFRLQANLTDGRNFSADDASGSLQGSYFKSPYQYEAGILCIPSVPFSGDYKIDMQDAYGDGWQGSHITVTIDGVSTEYSIPDKWMGGDPPFDARTEIVNVPDGTSTLLFEWTSGSYPGECTFQIYAPSGNLIAKGGPSPIDGEIALNLCDEE